MVDKMPDEYKGKTIYSTAYTKADGSNNGSRVWTEKEIEWVLHLVDNGYTLSEIADSVDRGRHSVSMKVKRLKKKRGDYNEKHLETKYNSNREYMEIVKPDSVADCFSGINRYWKNSGIKTIDNDINEKIEADYNMDANEFMKMFQDESFDVVDIDPFGSAYEYFDEAYRLAKHGMIVTFGEMGAKRWKRLDYVGNRYNIETLDQFNTNKIIEHWTNKYPDLKVYKVDEFQNISRVYFIKEKS